MSSRKISDADLTFDIQPLLDRCYENGRYDELNYRVDPNPPFSPADAAWAEEMLRAKGLR